MEREAVAAERRYVQAILRLGLGLALLLFAAGLLLHGPGEARSVRLSDVAPGDRPALPLSERLLGLGVLFLALTPAVRVVALFFGWLRERDYRFAAVAALVVAGLAAAVLVG